MQNHRFNRLIATGAIGLAGLGLVAMLPAASASAAPSSFNVNRNWGTSVANIQVQREDTGLLSVDFGVDMAKHTRWRALEGHHDPEWQAVHVHHRQDRLGRFVQPYPGPHAGAGH